MTVTMRRKKPGGKRQHGERKSKRNKEKEGKKTAYVYCPQQPTTMCAILMSFLSFVVTRLDELCTQQENWKRF